MSHLTLRICIIIVDGRVNEMKYCYFCGTIIIDGDLIARFNMISLLIYIQCVQFNHAIELKL